MDSINSINSINSIDGINTVKTARIITGLNHLACGAVLVNGS
ncbi:hypothetical protein [Moraxella lincolnii]|nr:hypothetical protein [Moraxella lincolnii]